VNAPHAGVAELPCGLAGSFAHGLPVTELGDHTMRWHLAVCMAGAGDVQLGPQHQRVGELPQRTHAIGRDGAAMGRDEIHESETQRLHPRMGRNVKSTVHGGRRFDQHLQGQAFRPGCIQGLRGPLDILHRFHLGHHEVHQTVAGTACDVGHVRVEMGVVHRVDPHGDAGVMSRVQRQAGDQLGVICLATHRGTIFTIEGDIEDTGAELLRHLGLQLQAFAHPHFDAAVVVADRQLHAAGLRPEQNVTRMAGHVQGPIRPGERRPPARRSAL